MGASVRDTGPMTTAAVQTPPFGTMMRDWRQRRRESREELSERWRPASRDAKRDTARGVGGEGSFVDAD